MKVDKLFGNVMKKNSQIAMNERGVCDELYGQNDAI